MIKDKNNASFAYGMNLLKILLGMKLITEEEYGKIIRISAAHYDAGIIYVWNINFLILSGLIRTHVVLLMLPKGKNNERPTIKSQ